MAKVIIDTDCGTDDMFCVGNFLAQHRLGNCNVIGITTVCGNITTSNAFQNMCRLVYEVLQISDVPVFQSESSFKNDRHCSFFYGQDGHSGAMEEHTKKTYKVPAISSEDFLIQQLKADPAVVVVAIGPLTNLHLADLKCPGVLNLAKQIMIMGGAVDVEGNCPLQEFRSEYNFGTDAPATEHVIRNANNITLFPLDLTTQIRFNMDNLLKRSQAHKMGKFFEKVILRDFEAMVYWGECERNDRRLNIHDVHVYIYFMNPKLYHTEDMSLRADQFGALIRSDDKELKQEKEINNTPTKNCCISALMEGELECGVCGSSVVEQQQHHNSSTPHDTPSHVVSGANHVTVVLHSCNMNGVDNRAADMFQTY